MEKLKSILTSKKFWTLVAALVAAYAAFFTVSCTMVRKVSTDGVHIDTVKTEMIIKSRKAAGLY